MQLCCHLASEFEIMAAKEKDRVTTLQTLCNSLTFPWRFAALSMLSVTQIMPVLVLNTCTDANMQLTINSFRQLFAEKIFSPTFPWFLVKSLTFPWQLSNSLTFPGFPNKWSPCTIQHYYGGDKGDLSVWNNERHFTGTRHKHETLWFLDLSH